MSKARDRRKDQLKRDIQFKKDLRHWRGMELDGPDQEENDLVDEWSEIQAEERRDQESCNWDFSVEVDGR